MDGESSGVAEGCRLACEEQRTPSSGMFGTTGGGGYVNSIKKETFGSRRNLPTFAICKHLPFNLGNNHNTIALNTHKRRPNMAQTFYCESHSPEKHPNDILKGLFATYP